MPVNESLQRNLSHNGSIISEANSQPRNHQHQENIKSQSTLTNQLSPGVIPTFDKRLAQADAFRNAKLKLEETLHHIQQKFSAHQDYRSCNAKNSHILDAYREYFLSSNPNSWHVDVLGYEIAMKTRFQEIETPSKQALRDLFLIYCNKLREYTVIVISELKLDSDIELSNMISSMENKEFPLEILVQKAYEVLLNRLPNPEAKQFVLSLQKTTAAAERASIYVRYYCSEAAEDTPQLKNFKAKYARMFENRLIHDEVLIAMRKEAHDLNSQRSNALHTELGELQLAQSAHLKKKMRKAEISQQFQDQESSQKSIHCCLERCGVALNVTDQNIECALCEWLERKGSVKGRSFYCSVEHAEEDFDNHDRHMHQCVAGEQCFYYPQAGPPGETSACGICSYCIQNKNILFYFCSTECYHHNIEWHAKKNHNLDSNLDLDHKQKDTSVLEHFKWAQDMHIIS